jgi:hypothetical protein
MMCPDAITSGPKATAPLGRPTSSSCHATPVPPARWLDTTGTPGTVATRSAPTVVVPTVVDGRDAGEAEPLTSDAQRPQDRRALHLPDHLPRAEREPARASSHHPQQVPAHL